MLFEKSMENAFNSAEFVRKGWKMRLLESIKRHNFLLLLWFPQIFQQQWSNENWTIWGNQNKSRKLCRFMDSRVANMIEWITGSRGIFQRFEFWCLCFNSSANQCHLAELKLTKLCRTSYWLLNWSRGPKVQTPGRSLGSSYPFYYIDNSRHASAQCTREDKIYSEISIIQKNLSIRNFYSQKILIHFNSWKSSK